jgi:uncharacterized membrane protein YcaP (DUF421 family)
MLVLSSMELIIRVLMGIITVIIMVIIMGRKEQKPLGLGK